MDFLKKIGQHLTAPKADVNLQLLDQYVVLGDNLEGTLIITAHETIDAEELRCELNCTETAEVIRDVYDPNLKRMVPRHVTENRVLYQTHIVCSPPHTASTRGHPTLQGKHQHPRRCTPNLHVSNR